MKTGKLPPSGFVFEKFVPNMFVKSNCPRKLSSLSFGDSRQILILGKGNEEYFQLKEGLNEKLKALHAKVVKVKNSFCFQNLFPEQEVIRALQSSLKSETLLEPADQDFNISCQFLQTRFTF